MFAEFCWSKSRGGLAFKQFLLPGQMHHWHPQRTESTIWQQTASLQTSWFGLWNGASRSVADRVTSVFSFEVKGPFCQQYLSASRPNFIVFLSSTISWLVRCQLSGCATCHTCQYQSCGEEKTEVFKITEVKVQTAVAPRQSDMSSPLLTWTCRNKEATKPCDVTLCRESNWVVQYAPWRLTYSVSNKTACCPSGTPPFSIFLPNSGAICFVFMFLYLCWSLCFLSLVNICVIYQKKVYGHFF